MSEKFSRRAFLKGTAAGAASLAATSILGGCASECEPSVQPASTETCVCPTTTSTCSTLNPQDYDYRDTNTDFKTLFSPWKFGGITLNHRMVKSAAGSDTCNAIDKSTTEACAYYSNFIKGGVELVWIEDYINLYEHFPSTRKKAKDVCGIKDIVKAVHDAGGYCGYQLSCMGQKFTGFDPATAPQYASANAEDLSDEEVKIVIEEFINGAKFLKEAGVDAVEINAAGNNIGQAFFSRQRNHRSDQYGPQSFENRARFVGEIIKGIKEACGQDYPVQVLINAIEENDINMGDASLSTTVEENCEICKVLESYGANSIHARLGVFRMHVNQFASDLYFTGYGIEGTAANGSRFDFSRHFEGKLVANHSGAGLMLNVAAELKKALSIPVGVVTYMDPAHAPKFFEDALAEGKADFYLMNRPLTVDTEYVNKLKEGRLDEIAPCTRCMHCHFDYNDEGKVYEHCRVNACTQRAYREAMPEGYDVLPADGDKKVMVIGGGPAGMEAARIAAQRGYKVTLHEKKGYLGGLLPFASAIKGPHENLDDLTKYLTKQQELKGVEVKVNSEVTKEVIETEKPDVVILAVGGKRTTSGLSSNGKTNVISIDDVASATIGDNVTIIGSNMQAVDVAQYLIAHGKHVTIVTSDPLSRLDRGQSSWVKQFTVPMLYGNGTRVWPNAKVSAVNDGEVVIDGETGVAIKIACDTVIEAMDMEANTELANGLSGMDVYTVGDCANPYNIAEAIASANLTARKI